MPGWYWEVVLSQEKMKANWISYESFNNRKSEIEFCECMSKNNLVTRYSIFQFPFCIHQSTISTWYLSRSSWEDWRPSNLGLGVLPWKFLDGWFNDGGNIGCCRKSKLLCCGNLMGKLFGSFCNWAPKLLPLKPEFCSWNWSALSK